MMVSACQYSLYLCGKVVYDSDRDTGIKGGRAQRETECVRHKSLETSVFTDLDQSAAAVTADLVGEKTHTHTCLHVSLMHNFQTSTHKYKQPEGEI